MLLQARQKLAGVMQQKRSLELDIEELQQKYAQKSRWVQPLVQRLDCVRLPQNSAPVQ